MDLETQERKAWRTLRRAIARLNDAHGRRLGQTSFDVFLTEVDAATAAWAKANRALCKIEQEEGPQE